MGAALDTVNRFYATTLERGDLDGIAPLVDPDITFEGPMQRLAGADAYVDINRQLLPMHVATRMQAQFERGDEVCSIYELDWRNAGGRRGHRADGRLDPGARWSHRRPGRVLRPAPVRRGVRAVTGGDPSPR